MSYELSVISYQRGERREGRGEGEGEGRRNFWWAGAGSLRRRGRLGKRGMVLDVDGMNG